VHLLPRPIPLLILMTLHTLGQSLLAPFNENFFARVPKCSFFKSSFLHAPLYYHSSGSTIKAYQNSGSNRLELKQPFLVFDSPTNIIESGQHTICKSLVIKSLRGLQIFLVVLGRGNLREIFPLFLPSIISPPFRMSSPFSIPREEHPYAFNKPCPYLAPVARKGSVGIYPRSP